jgi:hypothetical protein
VSLAARLDTEAGRLGMSWLHGLRLTDSSIPPKGQVSKVNKEALKKALIEVVTRLNNEEVDFSEAWDFFIAVRSGPLLHHCVVISRWTHRAVSVLVLEIRIFGASTSRWGTCSVWQSRDLV